MANKKKKAKPGCPLWMVTLGDVSALMLTFFVMLLSFSSFEKESVRKVMGIMDGAFSTSKSLKGDLYSSERTKSKTPLRQTDMRFSDDLGPLKEKETGEKSYRDSIRKRFLKRKRRLVSKRGEKHITYANLLDGVHIMIQRDAIFKNPQNLTSDARDLLTDVANLAANTDNELRIVDCLHLSGNSASIEDKRWGDALSRTETIGTFLHKTFNIKKNRFGYGIRPVSADRKPFIDLVILEKLPTNRVTHGRLVNIMKERN